jgi:hypothetical protein
MTTTTKTTLTTIDDRRPVPEGEMRRQADEEEGRGGAAWRADVLAADESAVADGTAEIGANEAAEEVEAAEMWAVWNDYLWRVGDLHDGHDRDDAASGQAEHEAARQALIDAFGGKVPPYDVTDDFEGQRVALAAFMQWAADRYAAGLAPSDDQPKCWLCARYPCETYATELPCPGGYAPVTMRAEESDLIPTELARRRRARILAQVGEEARTTVMTPMHPRWPEFAARLADAIDAEGCNSVNCRLSRRLLRGFEGLDVEASVDWFRTGGGFCDCEVLANVANGW